MSQENYLKDISEIKNIMNKSSKFISLSGISGVLAGFYALIGSVFAYWLESNHKGEDLFYYLLIDLFLVGVFSIVTGIILTTKKAKKNDEKIWTTLTKNLLFSFLVPLITGGIYLILILNSQDYQQAGTLMLLFYGLALFSASKYTLGDVKYLGLTEISLGLLSAIFPDYSFQFWIIGFGFMHILYGVVMHFKYDRK